MTQENKQFHGWRIIASAVVSIAVSGCVTTRTASVAPPIDINVPVIEASAVDTLQEAQRTDVDLYEGTSAEDFPPDVLVEEFSAAGDTLFVDDYTNGDTSRIGDIDTEQHGLCRNLC